MVDGAPRGSLASALEELLLPANLASLPAGGREQDPGMRSARWRLSVVLGRGGSDLFEDSGARFARWAAVPERFTERVAPLKGIAEKLWRPEEDGALLPHRVELLLGVADPFSNAITLSWRVRPGAHLLDPLPGGSEHDERPGSGAEHLISEQVERFLAATRSYESQLVRRPALHLAFVGPGKAPPRLERDISRVLRQLGLYLADFQVRWVDEALESDGGKGLLRELLLLHQPWTLWPRDLGGLSRDAVGSLEAHLQVLSESLEANKAVLSDPSSRPFEAVRAARELASQVPSNVEETPSNGAAVRPDLQPEEEIVESPGSVWLGLRLRARKWWNEPFDLPLSSMTLVAGANASGKTTLAEALCSAFTGLPRPRLHLPDRARSWHAAEDGSEGEPASLALLRLRLGGAGEGSVDDVPSPGLRLQARELLPLFADDADLASGTSGDLAVVTWLPFAGLRPPGTVGGTAGTEIAELFAGAALGLQEIRECGAQGEIGRDPSLGKQPADPSKKSRKTGGRDINVAPWVLSALRQVLDRFEPNGSSGKKLEVAREGLAGRRTRLPLGLLDDYQPELAREIRDPVQWAGSESGWDELKKLDEALGGSSKFADLALTGYRAALKEADDKLRALSEKLSKALFRQTNFEAELDRYLAGGIHPRQEADLRPSTAGVVRTGQASRLARWLSCGGVDWPFLVVDEPTLGQDDASCARTLVRYLRLLRKVEGFRWWAHLSASPSREAGGRAGRLEALSCNLEPKEGDTRIEAVRDSASPLPELPFAPQILALSYREPALSVVADLEGTVLDERIASSLRRLIPREWGAVLERSWRQAVEELRNFLGSQVLVPSLPMPPVLLRKYWRPPLEETMQGGAPSGTWWEEAKRALRDLGLDGIATDLEREGEANVDPGEAAWRLLAWLLAVDLLPAALADGERHFALSGVSFRTLEPHDGEPREQGPARLRRIVPCMDFLPALPTGWQEGIEKGRALRREPAGAGADRPAKRGIRAPEVRPVATPIEGKGEPDRGLEVPPAKREPRVWRVTLGMALSSAPARWTRNVSLEEPLPEDPDLLAVERLARELRWAGFEEVSSLGSADGSISWEVREEFGSPRYRWRIEALPKFSEGSWQGLESAVESLLQALVTLRVERVAGNAARDERAVQVVLASYNRLEAPAPSIDFRFTADPPYPELDPFENEAYRAQWERIFGRGLLRLRSGLATSPATRTVRLFPVCTPATALRVGAVFHRATGFKVQCDQGRELWDLDHPAPESEELELEELSEAAEGEEVHCLVSIAVSVLDVYERWRSEVKIVNPTVLHFSPPGSPGRETLSGGGQAAAWAAQMFRAMTAYRTSREQPFRLFMAVPVALAVALGRELNAAGRVIAMDLDKNTRRYFDAFDFTAG